MAVVSIPVVKAKDIIEFDTKDLPDDVYTEAVILGLKTLVNRGMTKCTVKDLGDEATVKSEAMIIASKNKEKILAGDIKFSGKAKATKVSGVVNTEAMRIARERVKDAAKKAGYKISTIKASQITEAAKALIAQDDTIIEQAKANIEARTATPMPFDIKSLVKEDPELVAKANAAAAKKKADKPLSAKQAGMVKGRKAKATPSADASASVAQ